MKERRYRAYENSERNSDQQRPYRECDQGIESISQTKVPKAGERKADPEYCIEQYRIILVFRESYTVEGFPGIFNQSPACAEEIQVWYAVLQECPAFSARRRVLIVFCIANRA